MLPAAMTSLPMPACLSTNGAMTFAPAQENSRGESEQFLLQAFRSFAEAADSLERSYGMLRSEVARLHAELEQSHAGLQRSLEENRQMREHLDRILEGLPCGVLVAGADGKITLLNPEGRRLLSSPRAAHGETSVFETGLEHNLETGLESGLESDFESALSAPGELHDLLQRARTETGEQERCLRDGHGGERWLAVRHAAMAQVTPDQPKVSPGKVSPGKAGESGNVQENNENHSADCASIFILRDISDAKRLVQERDKLRREQALAEMSAILAHEIRNPLGSLELFAGLLAGAGLSAECQQWVEHVQAGLRTLAATVNNVLHFHNLPAPERVPIDLGQLLDWAGGFLLPMARQARVELCLRNRLHGIWFAADRHRLEQVLLNLVLNSFRAMPGGGWVEISGQKFHQGNTANALISVGDTGPGVPAGNATKIFDPGFSTHAGSPGLGLTVCRKIVEQHGGTLAAGNRSGAGASFTLTFPLPKEPLKEISHAELAAPRSGAETAAARVRG